MVGVALDGTRGEYSTESCGCWAPGAQWYVPQGGISWFVYVVRLHERFTSAQRDAVLEHIASTGIGCGRYLAPIHMQPSYGARRNSYFLPVTESVSARTLALPFFNN